MITYNHANFISQAIEGVLKQKCSFRFELVIGEDCSTDDTLGICHDYANKHSNVRVLPTERNLGMIKNFFRTIHACSGKYIAFCEGDDFWIDPDKIQKQVFFLESNPEFGLISSDIILVNRNGSKLPDNNKLEKQRSINRSEIVLMDLLELNMINTPTVCVDGCLLKQIIEKAEKEEIYYAFDYWCWTNIALFKKIYITQEKTAAYRIHDLGFSLRESSTIKNYSQHTQLYILDKIFTEYNTMLNCRIYRKRLGKRIALLVLWSKYLNFKEKWYLFSRAHAKNIFIIMYFFIVIESFKTLKKQFNG